MTTEFRTDSPVSGDPATNLWGVRDEGGHVVWVTGEVDLANADELVDVVATFLESDAPPVLVLDLSGVTFMDSTGFERLYTGMRRIEAAGRRLTLRSPSAPVLRVLDLLQMTQEFDIV